MKNNLNIRNNFKFFLLNFLNILLLVSCDSNNSEHRKLDTLKVKDITTKRDTVIIIDTIKISKSNYKAIIEVETRLKMVELDMQANHNHSVIPPALGYLEDLTGIIYETGGDFIGPYCPKLSDYKKWRDWFEKNKYKLYWDEKEQKVKLRE